MITDEDKLLTMWSQRRQNMTFQNLNKIFSLTFSQKAAEFGQLHITF